MQSNNFLLYSSATCGGVGRRPTLGRFAPHRKQTLLSPGPVWSVVLVACVIPSQALCPAEAQEPRACPIRLSDVSAQVGIDFRHTDGSCGRRYIVETVTAGLALFDYDTDGDIDIYFLNGAPTRGSDVKETPRNALYRNEGNWQFTDVTTQAGVGDTGFGLGVAAADYDNDGDQDLYVNNFGPNVLYQNNGDGTFTDVTAESGVGAGSLVGAGACFLDIEADGDLDLYVANYVQFNYENHVDLVVGGFPKYVGPKDYEPEPDILYRNNGDGTFTDISREAGIAEHAGSGMGMVGVDFDNDADTDIAVLNDVAGNFLFENDGTGKFSEISLIAGFGFTIDGQVLGSMGIDCGDYNNDGFLDLFQTAYAMELPALYRNSGMGFFEDVTRAARAGISAYPFVNWGTGLVDFDNDGFRDLFIANGHLQDNVEQYSDTTTYEARNNVLWNMGDGTFHDVSDQCGDGLAPKLSSRGAGFDDLDGDGDVDVVILNSRRKSTLLRNDLSPQTHWIEIRLRGTQTNRDGVGAHVRVVAGNLTQLAEVHSGRGYQGHYGTRLHFGLGPRASIERIDVRWIGGRQDTFEQVAVDQIVMLSEGGGVTRLPNGSMPQ